MTGDLKPLKLWPWGASSCPWCPSLMAEVPFNNLQWVLVNGFLKQICGTPYLKVDKTQSFFYFQLFHLLTSKEKIKTFLQLLQANTISIADGETEYFCGVPLNLF